MGLVPPSSSRMELVTSFSTLGIEVLDCLLRVMVGCWHPGTTTAHGTGVPRCGQAGATGGFGVKSGSSSSSLPSLPHASYPSLSS